MTALGSTIANLSPFAVTRTLSRGTAAIRRIEEILHADIVIKEPENPQPITSFNDSIEFKNVSFAYEGVEVLHHINLKINKGKTVALVGSSGDVASCRAIRKNAWGAGHARRRF